MKKLLLGFALALLLAPPNVLAQDYYRGTGPFSITIGGVGATPTDGLTLQNTTAATVGTPQQISPRESFCGYGWNTSGAQAERDCVYLENLPSTGVGTTNNQFLISSSINGGARVVSQAHYLGDVFVNGQVTPVVQNYIQTDIASMMLGSGGFFAWNNKRAGTSASGNGLVTFYIPTANYGQGNGIGLGWVNDGTLTIRGKAQTAGTGNLDVGAKVTAYNQITTAGMGVPLVVASANISAQTTNATITSYANGAADADFDVRGQMSVTVSTTLATTITCTYTDVANVARTMILPIVSVNGTFVAAGAISGAGATIWETPVMHIRAKASTTITILTSAGTFTGVTYSASGVITELN